MSLYTLSVERLEVTLLGSPVLILCTQAELDTNTDAKVANLRFIVSRRKKELLKRQFKILLLLGSKRLSARFISCHSNTVGLLSVMLVLNASRDAFESD